MDKTYKIKPLEWEEMGDGKTLHATVLEGAFVYLAGALSKKEKIQIGQMTGKNANYRIEIIEVVKPMRISCLPYGFYNTLPEAKAACEANYRKRLESVLEVVQNPSSI